MLHIKDADRGFTIIDLLVFIVINSLLAAVALPVILTKAQKAEQAEAKRFVGAMNRAQQAYFFEHDKVFAPNSSFKQLGLGTANRTKNYTYAILGGGNGATFVTNQARLNKTNSLLKAYVGGVNIVVSQKTKSTQLMSVLCEAHKSPANAGPMGSESVTAQFTQGPVCPSLFVRVK